MKPSKTLFGNAASYGVQTLANNVWDKNKKILDLTPLEQLSKPTVFNRIESFFTPKLEDVEHSEQATKAIDAEKHYLKKRYNVTARLTGSMPQKLNIPGDVDLDFFVRVDSKPKFDKLVNKLTNSSRYTPSSYNVDNAGFHVFSRAAENDKEYPVDLAVAYGDPAKQYVGVLTEKRINAMAIPEPLRKRLVAQKNTLKHTPFDVKNKRYKRWKRKLDGALGSDMRLTREKVSRVIDPTSEEGDRFTRFLGYKDLVGHRTPHAAAVLGGGKILSSLEAQSRGKLKSFEFKGTVGDRKSSAEGPVDEKHLTKNIYVTGGGLLDEPSYGDVGILFRNRTSEKSPFLNLITNERIITPKDEDKFRQGKLKGDAYVIAKRDKVNVLNKAAPGYRYVAEEDLTEEQRKKLFLKTKSLGEIGRRWVPAATAGKLQRRKYAAALRSLLK